MPNGTAHEHGDDHFTPERSYRLLMAKANELEFKFRELTDVLEDDTDGISPLVIDLLADVAIVARLLADHLAEHVREASR